MTDRDDPDPAERDELTEQDLAIATLVGRYIERREQGAAPRVHDLLSVAAEFGDAAVDELRAKERQEVLRSGVPAGCQLTVMSAPCSCGVFTLTFSRRSRNTHVSFTPGRSTPVSLETFCEVKSVSSTGFAKLSRSKAGLSRSSGVIRKITSTSNLVPWGGAVNGASG